MADDGEGLKQPVITVETARFWAAANEGRLLYGRCMSCDKAHYYPRARCPHCWSGDVEWTPARGRGTIYSFSFARKAEPPYVIAYVTLDEGVTVLTNLVDCAVDDIRIGQPVALVFRRTAQGQAIPVFTPVL